MADPDSLTNLSGDPGSAPPFDDGRDGWFATNHLRWKRAIGGAPLPTPVLQQLHKGRGEHDTLWRWRDTGHFSKGFQIDHGIGNSRGVSEAPPFRGFA